MPMETRVAARRARIDPRDAMASRIRSSMASGGLVAQPAFGLTFLVDELGQVFVDGDGGQSH